MSAGGASIPGCRRGVGHGSRPRAAGPGAGRRGASGPERPAGRGAGAAPGTSGARRRFGGTTQPGAAAGGATGATGAGATGAAGTSSGFRFFSVPLSSSAAMNTPDIGIL